MKEGDVVESTDWRESGVGRKVVFIPPPGHGDHGYCFLEKANGKASTRVRLKKDGLPERYRLVTEDSEEE